MNIIFYVNNSDKNVIGKTKLLRTTTTLSGELKEGSDIINPSILIQYDGLINSNYCYISEFGRYYYITDITNVSNTLWEISMHVDALESFKSSILANKCYITRQENSFDRYIRDDMTPIYSDSETVTKLLTNYSTFDTSSIVLLVNSAIANTDLS